MNLDIKDHTVLSRARAAIHFGTLEQTQRVQALFGAIDHQGVVGIALRQAELAANNVILGPLVADNVDALDVDPRTFIDDVRNADRPARHIGHGARAHASKRVSRLSNCQRQLFGRLIDQRRVVDVALVGQKLAAVGIARHLGKRTVDRDGAEIVKLALFDSEGDDETGAIRIKLGLARSHRRVGVTVLEVVLAHQLAVERHAVGIVDAGAFDEVEPACLRRRHDVAQLAIRECPVADEVDAFDLGGRAFRDFEYEIDAILLKLDDFGLDSSGETALTAIDVENALHVGLGACAREN